MSEEDSTAPSTSNGQENEATAPESSQEEEGSPDGSSDPPPAQDESSATSTSPAPTPAPEGEDSTEQQQQDQQQPKDQRKAVVAPLPLDWTRMNECDEAPENIVHYPWDVVEIDPNEADLTIVGTHGQKITHMGSELQRHVSPKLTHLILRSHLIKTMEGIGGMEHLELLELYDNMVDELCELDGPPIKENSGENGESGEEGIVKKSGLPGKNLRVLDISYNVIRDMGPVSLCPNLQELYIAQNKIKSIKGIKHLKLLRKIDLGANRIRVMDGEELSGLENLEELWLGKNKIEHIEGLDKLTKLRRLDVQSNRLTKIENLEAQVNTLEELYLAHNGIDVEGAKCASGLALPFKELNTIDLSRNRLADTSPFAHLTSLSDLWISGNDIKSFDDIESLGSLTELDSVYLEYNPVASEFEYRKKVAELIPSLSQIDANMIGGLAQHGYTSAGGDNLVERMRQMQEAAIQKAKAESEAADDVEQETAAAVEETSDDQGKVAAADDEEKTAAPKEAEDQKTADGSD